MKTSFPPPYNPENFPPSDAGYRYIGANEKPLPTDEVYLFSSKRWVSVKDIGNPEFNKASDITWTFRRRIDSENANTSPFLAKPTLKPGQTIVVRVHDSQALSHAVQQIAFDYGWKWAEGIKDKAINIRGHTEGGVTIHIPWNKNHFLLYSSLQWMREKADKSPNKYLLLDARTDLGTLIDLLDERDKAPTPPKVNGYEAQFNAGDTEITFGCAKINLVLLEKTASLMGYVIDKDYRIMKNAGLLIGGNRSVVSVKLDSGVELKSSDIIATLDYVHDVITKTHK